MLLQLVLIYGTLKMYSYKDILKAIVIIAVAYFLIFLSIKFKLFYFKFLM
jgi:hypothetical protein